MSAEQTTDLLDHHSLAAWKRYDETVEYEVQTEGGMLDAGTTVYASCKNGEVFFSTPNVHGGKEAPIDALGLSEFDKVNLLGALLYKYAERGYDPDPSDAKGASCHIVTDNSHPQAMRRVFIGSNQNHYARGQRPDAEITAISRAKEIVGTEHLTVNETFLTLRHSKTKPGDLITPCGTCREELTNFKAPYMTDDALLYCLPCQEPGELKLLTIDDQSNQAEPNMASRPRMAALKMRTRALVPYRDMKFPARVGKGEQERSTAKVIKEGMDWVQDPDSDFAPLTVSDEQLVEMGKAARTGREHEVTHLQGDGFSTERVNMFLANKLKHAYCDMASRPGFEEGDLYKTRAALIKLSDGRCFASLYTDAKGYGAKALGELAALSNANNPSTVSDVYVMEMKPERIEKQYQKSQSNPDYQPDARAVFPEALGRLFKSAKDSKQTWTRQVAQHSEELQTRCLIHTLPLNDGRLTQKELAQVVSTETIECLQPGPFAGVNGGHESTGCCP